MMLLVSFQSETQQKVASSSVTGHLVCIVSHFRGAVQSTTCSPDLHRPVAGRQYTASMLSGFYNNLGIINAEHLLSFSLSIKIHPSLDPSDCFCPV